MRRTRFDDWPCPIARVNDLTGDWWTPLVLRELSFGKTRFDEIRRELGCSASVLTQRLNRLGDEGLVTRSPYQQHPTRYEYHLTDKGSAFWPVLAAMWRFGSDWLFDEPPSDLIDNATGQVVRPVLTDELSGRPLALSDVHVARRRRTAQTVERAGADYHHLDTIQRSGS